MWGRLATCGGLLTRPTQARLPIARRLTTCPTSKVTLLPNFNRWTTGALASLETRVYLRRNPTCETALRDSGELPAQPALHPGRDSRRRIAVRSVSPWDLKSRRLRRFRRPGPSARRQG